MGKSLPFDYVEPAYASPASEFDIRVVGDNRRATVLAEPAYDAKNLRLRS